MALITESIAQGYRLPNLEEDYSGEMSDEELAADVALTQISESKLSSYKEKMEKEKTHGRFPYSPNQN